MFKGTQAFCTFSVNDIEKAKDFYETVLGLEVTLQNNMLQLHIAGNNKIIIYPKPNHQPATFTVLNFPVDDLELMMDKLRHKGVSFEVYEGITDQYGVARGISQKMGPDIAWFKDPAGNILSVLQEA